MAKRAAAVLARAVRWSKSDLAALSDRDLIQRFVESGDQSAFAAVVQRHSAMVIGVCQRGLHSPADAEDACQAVFLILAKKAKGTRWQASVANWLYTTARKVAHNARLAAARRGKREGAVAVSESVPPFDAMTGRELVAALDEELDKLPPRYREPLVLCYLEGLTRDEAATRLKLPEATLKSQLERGRMKLADALTARGCALGVALLTAAATSSAGASPPRLIESILVTVGGSPSASVAALAQGVAVNGVLTRTKLLLSGIVGIAVLGFGVAAMPIAAEPQKPTRVMENPKADSKVEAKPSEAQERTITGMVLGPDGKPVAGATINTLKDGKFEKPVVQELAKTGADGKFSATLVPMPPGRPEFRQIVAVKPGFGPDWANVNELGDSPVSLKLVADDVPVTGRVTDLEGRPVAKATVRVRTVASGNLSKVWEGWSRRPESALHSLNTLWPGVTGGLPETVIADADGKFEIKGVGRGRLLDLTFEADGIETAACRVVTDPAFDPKKVEQPNEKTMPGGGYQPGPALYGSSFTHTAKPCQPITGTVTDAKSGKPIAGVQVNGHDDGPHWYENGGQGAKTDAAGKFVLKGIAKTDRVRLMVFPTPTQPYFPYSTRVSGKPGLTEITAELKLTRGVLVKGRVVEKGTGKPVAGAGVRYAALADNKYYGELMNGKQGEHGMAWSTDADGKFEFVALPGAGIVTAQGETRGGNIFIPYTQVRVAKDDLPRADLKQLDNLGEMFIAADGHYVTLHSLSGYKIIEPKLTDDTVEVTIEFDRGKTVSGTVVDADGKPAAGVTAYKLEACYSSKKQLKDGTFTAVALDPDHPRTVLFIDEAKKLSATIDLKGDEKDVTLKLQPWGKIGGRLLDAEGKPIAGASVSVHAKNSVQHMAFMSLVHNRNRTTDADGRFTFDVPAGPVEYLVGFSVKNKYVDVGAKPNDPGRVVKPGETTDVGELKAKGE